MELLTAVNDRVCLVYTLDSTIENVKNIRRIISFFSSEQSFLIPTIVLLNKEREELSFPELSSSAINASCLYEDIACSKKRFVFLFLSSGSSQKCFGN